MPGSPQTSFCVRNTFIDIETEEDSHLRREARRRFCSAPPAIRRSSREEEIGRDSAEQLVRLDAIAHVAEKPQELGARSPAASDASTAPSPLTGVRLLWSSCADDDEGDSPTSLQSGAASMLGSGSYPSVGSAGHALGKCRPCAFARSSAGCKFGAECSFCHLVSEHPEAVRMRPCKGKRERFKRAMAAIEGKVAQNPELLNNGALVLPAYVERNTQARERIMAQLAQMAAEARGGVAVAAR